jgi:DNA invertase Pin-like site-specific DNA recombinase
VTACLGYLRVSSEAQAESGLGIAAQRASIEAEAQRRGWEVEFIEDAGVSAKTLDRPGMASALAKLTAGEANTLVVSRLDRLARSMANFTDLMARAHREGWAIVALDLGVDTSTAEGELMANVRASFAAYERRLISIRTKEALAALKAQGVKLGHPNVIGDDVAAVAVELRSRGLTLRAIGQQLSERGHVPPNGSTWYPSTVNGLLRRVGSSCA